MSLTPFNFFINNLDYFVTDTGTFVAISGPPDSLSEIGKFFYANHFLITSPAGTLDAQFDTPFNPTADSNGSNLEPAKRYNSFIYSTNNALGPMEK